MLHQGHNTYGDKIYNAIRYENANFPVHFHRSFEIMYLTGDDLTVTIDNTILTLHDGEYAIVFPYVKHSLSTSVGQNLWVGVFSGDFIPELEKIALAKRPVVKPFSLGKSTQNFIDENIFKITKDASDNRKLSQNDEFCVKSGLYAIIQAFLANAEFKDVQKSDELIMNILHYVEENFTDNITLKTASSALGYHYQYISRVFGKTMHMSFRSLINQYRFDYARHLLENNNYTVTRAALESGFQSVRNFNRVYKEFTGKAPLSH